MADKVRAVIEEFIPKLRYLEENEYFSEEELRSILVEREKHEYRMIKN